MVLERLSAASLNLWKNDGRFEDRLPLIAHGLASLGADVICLQECFIAPELGVDAAATLAAHLGYAIAAAPARQKPRRHHGAMVDSSSGLAILSRAPLAVQQFGLASDPADGQRIAQWAPIADGLSILNLHLSHLRGPEGDGVRRAQLQDALDWALAQGAGGLIVAGDLNASAGSPALAPLFDFAGLDRGPDPAGAEAPSFQGERPGARVAHPAIDHAVLIPRGSGWRVTKHARALNEADPALGIFPSDHMAVLIALEQGGA